MRISDFLVRELGRRQVVLFFLLATSLYVLPLILADFPYIDDNWCTWLPSEKDAMPRTSVTWVIRRLWRASITGFI
ncbi:hypothetical protein JFT91_13005 [Pseudomonas sp. TH08]|uniref:hypothetical protein n=1 Tax=Pseudomonas sp. TH08 TaxID=2796374 RepID=UPI001913390C|nr:hypothetical protein [Pseudomonas sp. TH08]MBK5533514.1 hypothetical protein [Pseudomonas sp. TH08]